MSQMAGECTGAARINLLCMRAYQNIGRMRFVYKSAICHGSGSFNAHRARCMRFIAAVKFGQVIEGECSNVLASRLRVLVVRARVDDLAPKDSQMPGQIGVNTPRRNP